MAELTVYGDSADCQFNKAIISAEYITVRNALTCDSVLYADNVETFVGQQSQGAAGYVSHRAPLYFDCSALPDNAVVSAVVLHEYCREKLTTSADFDLCVVDGDSLCMPAVVENYGLLRASTVSFGSENTADINAGWFSITLDANGRAKINPTGFTKFGLRSSRDINGSAPAYGLYERIELATADSSGKEPYLVITYTSATPSVNTDDASSITTTGATMNGTLVDDGGGACDCNFQWGRTTAYGNTSTAQSKTTGQTFLQALTGLLPNTLYHFRAKAVDNGNTGYGADKTFMTLAPVAGAAPTVVSGLVGALRWYFGPGTYVLEIGLGGYGRAFSTEPWGHYGASDPEGHPDLTPAPEYDVCAMAAEAHTRMQQFEWNRYSLLQGGMTPEEWEFQHGQLRNIYHSLHAACSLARRLEGGATGVNK